VPSKRSVKPDLQLGKSRQARENLVPGRAVWPCVSSRFGVQPGLIVFRRQVIHDALGTRVQATSGRARLSYGWKLNSNWAADSVLAGAYFQFFSAS
jgi:hypothetical protein